MVCDTEHQVKELLYHSLFHYESAVFVIMVLAVPLIILVDDVLSAKRLFAQMTGQHNIPPLLKTGCWR